MSSQPPTASPPDAGDRSLPSAPPPTNPPVADAGSPDATEPSAAVGDCRARFPAAVAAIERELAKAATPGAALGLVVDGEVACASGIGVKRVGTSNPVTARTLFDINSMTKSFTAAAAMREAERNKLDLDAPVTRYVPTLRLAGDADPASITVRQLLSHTAGYADVPIDPTAVPNIDYAAPNAVTDFFLQYRGPLWSPPGRLWSYSNLGYALAGLAIEKASGTSLHDLVIDEIVRPLGMKATTFESSGARDVSSGHYHDGSTVTPLDTGSTQRFSTAFGGLFSNAEEMARYLAALLAGGDHVLTPDSVKTLTRAGVPEGNTSAYYGLGWFNDVTAGVSLVSHSGGGKAFVSNMAMLPSRRFGVVILVNDANFESAFSLTAEVGRIVLGSWPLEAAIQTSPATWTKFEGTYDDPVALGKMVVTLEGRRLFVAFPATGDKSELHQTDENVFYFSTPASLPVAAVMPVASGTFWLDEAGKGEYVATRLGIGARAKP